MSNVYIVIDTSSASGQGYSGYKQPIKAFDSYDLAKQYAYAAEEKWGSWGNRFDVLAMELITETK